MAVKQFPPQHQPQQPGHEQPMHPQPQTDNPKYRGSGRLKDKVAIVTGGDSGIGRAVVTAFAKEGANIAIVYLNEHEDADQSKRDAEKYGAKCILLAGDVGNESFCQEAVEKTVREFGRLDVLVNNAGEQHPQPDIEQITKEQLARTFETNIFAMFYFVKAAMPHLKPGAAIVNTASVTAYEGSPKLLDYSSTKGAIVAFTRSLSQKLADKGIRVNAVAPGPIWTPLIVSTFNEDQVKKFGTDVPLKRAGQPSEVAPSFVFLASEDASYMSGQVLHPNGGEVVGS